MPLLPVEPHQHPDLDNNIEEVAEAVLGPRKSELRGGGRYEAQGLLAKVEELAAKVDENTNMTNQIARKLNNGGIRIRLHPAVWAAIITASAAMIIQVIDSIWELRVLP